MEFTEFQLEALKVHNLCRFTKNPRIVEQDNCHVVVHHTGSYPGLSMVCRHWSSAKRWTFNYIFAVSGEEGRLITTTIMSPLIMIIANVPI